MAVDIEIREVRIPYRFDYGHARHQHRDLAAVVCLARDEAGPVGLGEAVPRSYVTGETCASVRAALPRLAEMLSVDDQPLPAARRQRVELARGWQGPFPSCALCALDTALVDLQSRQARQPLAEWLGAACPQQLEYTASIGVGGRARVTAQVAVYRLLGLRQFKVKVGDENDVSRVQLVRRLLGRQARLFADANGVWDPETAIRRIEALAKLNVWAVEEPLRAPPPPVTVDGQQDRAAALRDDHYKQYRWLRDRSPLPLIADESLICWQTALRIVNEEAFDILNIRLSKCGGPLLAAEMAALATGEGLHYSVGAMVGETPILAVAGAHFAAAHPARLYLQGYSHRLLHRTRFVRGEPPIRRGRLTVPAGQCGLGLTLDTKQLDAVTTAHQLVKR